MKPLSRSRLVRTVAQLGRLRLAVAGVAGLGLLAVGVLVDPLTKTGVVFVSLGTGVLASTVVSAVALEREEWANTIMSLGVQEVFPDRGMAFTNEFWQSLIKAARHHFRMLGVANHGYLRNESIKNETAEAIRQAVQDHEITVEILWLNPEHELATIREEEEGVRGTRDDTIESIDFFWRIREGLHDEEARERLVLKEHKAMPTCGIHWCDDLVVVTHYLAQQLNLGSPGFVLGPSMSMVDRLVDLIRRDQARHPEITDAYMSNYTQIAADAEQVTPERVEVLRGLKGTWGAESLQRQSEAELRDGREGNAQHERSSE